MRDSKDNPLKEHILSQVPKQRDIPPNDAMQGLIKPKDLGRGVSRSMIQMGRGGMRREKGEKINRRNPNSYILLFLGYTKSCMRTTMNK